MPKSFKDHQLRLRFEGVDSSFHVWVNGKELGYSQGSRNPSEFDITDFVNTDGENSLAVQVYQFCDGSYIEDQVSRGMHFTYLLGQSNFHEIHSNSTPMVMLDMRETYR